MVGGGGGAGGVNSSGVPLRSPLDHLLLEPFHLPEASTRSFSLQFVGGGNRCSLMFKRLILQFYD